MSIDNNTGYVTICIPNTRFKISYKPVDFDIIDFLELLNVKSYGFSRYKLSNY